MAANYFRSPQALQASHDAVRKIHAEAAQRDEPYRVFQNWLRQVRAHGEGRFLVELEKLFAAAVKSGYDHPAIYQKPANKPW